MTITVEDTCPCCGKWVDTAWEIIAGKLAYYVGCENCGTCAPRRPTEVKAVVAWSELASAMSASGQDPEGLEVKPASAVPQGDAP